MPGKVNLIRPDGAVVAATPHDARLLLTLGYRPETPEESIDRSALKARKDHYTSAGQQVLAGLEGAASGLTLGLADLAMEDDATRARAEFNPTTRFLGEVAGQVLPAIATLGGSVAARGAAEGAVEGGSVLARIAGLTPSGALSKSSAGMAERAFGQGLKSKVVGGLAEGVVSGLGGAVTQSTLSGDPLTAEQALAGMGLGTAFGIGAAGLAHGMEVMGTHASALAKAGGPDAELVARLADSPSLSTAAAHEAEGLADSPSLSTAAAHEAEGLVFEGPSRLPQRGGVLSGEITAKTEGELYGRHSLSGRPTKWEAPDVKVEPAAYNNYDAYDQVVEAAVPTHVWERFRASVDDFGSQATRMVNELDDAHQKAMIEMNIRRAKAEDSMLASPAAKRTQLEAYGDEVMGVATLSASGNPQVGPAMRKVRKAYRDLMAKDASGLSPAAVKYKEAVDELAVAAGFKGGDKYMDMFDANALGANVTVEGVEEASKHVEQVAEFAHAVREARRYMHPEAPTFARSHGTGEKFWAAIEHIQGSSLPEAAPFQKQLSDQIDELIKSAGVQTSGTTALERLSSLRDALNSAGREAADTWDAANWYLKTREGGRIHGAPRRPVGPEDAAPSPSPKPSGGPEAGKVYGAPEKPAQANAANPIDDVDVPANAANPIDDVDVPDDEPSPKKGRSWGDYMARRMRWEAAHRLSSAVLGKNAAASAPKLLRYGVTAAFMGLRGLATTAVKDAARKVSSIAAARSVVRASGPRSWGLWQSAHGHLTEEADQTAAFKARSDELRELATAGRDRLFAFSQELSAAGHTEFAYAVYKAATRAQDAIVERLPKDPPGTRWGTEYLWDAPAEQVEVFAQEYAAAFQPVDFLRAVGEDPEGIHPQAIETLRNAWPGLYDQFRAEALLSIGATGTKGMPRERLQALSLILDVPLDPTLDAQFVAAQQAMFQERPAPPPGDPGKTSGQPGRPPGADMTQLQRLQTR